MMFLGFLFLSSHLHTNRDRYCVLNTLAIIWSSTDQLEVHLSWTFYFLNFLVPRFIERIIALPFICSVVRSSFKGYLRMRFHPHDLNVVRILRCTKFSNRNETPWINSYKRTCTARFLSMYRTDFICWLLKKNKCQFY